MNWRAGKYTDRKYHGQDYNPDDIVTERVMMWIVPNRQTILE